MNNGKWPMVPLAEVARPISRTVEVQAGESYRTIGVKWWGEGAYERRTIDGAETAAKSLSIVRADDLIINKIWVRHGSTAIAGPDVDGCAASNEFPTFEVDPTKVLSRWLHWLSKTRMFWDSCDALSRGTSGKNRIKPERFLAIQIPLAPMNEQRRLVEKLDVLAASINAAKRLATILDLAHKALRGGAPLAPIGQFLGFVLKSIEPGRAVFEMPVDDRHHNPLGTLHGGIYCDLADAAMGYAYGAMLAEGETFTTIELKINFLRAVRKTTLTAEAKVVKAGSTLGYVECDVRDQAGNHVARAASTCMKLRADRKARP